MVWRNLFFAAALATAALPWSPRPLTLTDALTIVAGLAAAALLYAAVDRLLGDVRPRIAYQVSRLPFAVLIDAQSVLRARGIVNLREHLESLFEAKRLAFASIQDYFESSARNRAA
jgi:hypothetical protein